ncbi:MAG TPA: carboxypeptidase-like regulatory domain-containing protein [Candidatus Thermoplasmatota archaeon]|nr:carboxypeptidase-like regulatory domain-containing protein [Candidatus Thermoplasmatota archaeon]
MGSRGPVAGAVVALFLLFLLGGCAAGPAGEGDQLAADLSAAAERAQAESGADRGIISGVVVDVGIHPIPRANLTVLNQGITARADDNGIFVFPNLKPGIYTIQARAAGYLGVQTTSEVVAGETSKVRIQMDADPTPLPYHSPTLKFKGFFQVSFTGLVDEALDLFVFNQTYGPVTTPPMPSCTCHYVYHPEANATTHIVEIQWEANPPKPDDPTGQMGESEIVMDFNADKDPQPGLTFCYGSPCVTRFDGRNLSAELRTVDLGFWGDGTWPALNEEFNVFVTVFYNGAAPKDWSFIAGST